MSRLPTRAAARAAALAVFVAWDGGVAFADQVRDGAAGPLLVVVETGAGSGCNAAHVRQAVRDELALPLVPPMTPPPKSSNALLVSMDRERILVTFRGRGDHQVSRSIPAPPPGAARLRAVAWLAGNLVRDQISPLVADGAMAPLAGPGAVPPVPPAPAATAVGDATGPVPAATAAAEPAAVAPVRTEPPPLVVAPLAEAPDHVITSRSSAPPPLREPHWSVTIGGGPSGAWDRRADPSRPSFGLSPTWQIEVQHHRAEGTHYGLALDIGPEPRQMGGVAGIAGINWRWGSWLVETTAGAGIEVHRRWRGESTTTTPSGVATTYSAHVQPALYAKGMLAIGRPLTRAIDLFLRAGVHLASSDLLDDLYVSTSLGLRLRLP